MASLLRLSKYFTCFIRLNVVKYTAITAEKVLIANNSKCFSTSYLTRALESVAPQPPLLQTSSLSNSLESLDAFAKSHGRVNRSNVDRIFDELLVEGSVTSQQALMLIPCCARLMADEVPHSRTQLALTFWKKFEELGVELNLLHYNALLRVYIDNGHEFSPNNFLNMLKTKGIEPNRVTYVRLMHHYCQLGDMDGATGILQIMRDEQLPINENVFNTLLMGHCQAGDMPSALSTLDLMQQSLVNPSNETYRALMCGYAKSGDMEKVEEILKNCRNERIFLHNNDYLEVIYTLALNGWTEHIDKMITLSKKSMGYNQDCFVLILRLVNINQPDIGLKMLRTMIAAVNPDGKSVDIGSFFIRQLVKTKQPAEKVIEICQTIEEEGLNTRALFMATTVSLKYGAGHNDLSIELLDAIKNKEVTLNGNHFWSLLTSYCKQGDIKGVQTVIKLMTKSFKIRLSAFILRDRVLPFLPKEMPSDEMINMIVQAKNSPSSAAFAVLCYRLSHYDIAEAAKIAAAHNVLYLVPMLQRPLTTAYLHSKDTDSYLRILYDAVDHVRNTSANQEDTTKNITGRLIYELCLQLSVERSDTEANLLKTVLQGLLDKGLCINEETSRYMKKTLGDKIITEEMSTLIDQITAANTTTDLSEKRGITSLEDRLMTPNQDSRAAIHLQSQLLRQHCFKKDLVKAEAVKEKLEKVSSLYGRNYILLLGLFVHHELVDKAWSTYQAITQQSPKLTLMGQNVLKLAILLAKHQRNADYLQVINDNKEARLPNANSKQIKSLEAFNKNINALLTVVAEKGSIEELKSVYNALVTNMYIHNPSLFLTPFVKVHVKSNDLRAAIDEFKRCCYDYHVTPYKDNLCKALIMHENLEMLQEVTDLAAMVHGEDNTIFDLLFSFVECGKMGHAQKLLETEGISRRLSRVVAGCNRLLKKGMFEELENLLEGTKQYNHILGRSMIYKMLIDFYGKTNNQDRVAPLQARMQSESFLQSNTMLPKPSETPIAVRVRQLSRDRAKKGQSTLKPSNNIQVVNLVNAYCSETLEGKIIPNQIELKFVCQQLAEVGDVDRIEEMRKFVPNKLGKLVWWERFLCIANVVAGKGAEVLSHLEHKINEAKTEDVETLKRSYPMNASARILQENPELVQRFEDMARSYAVRDIFHPINDLWAHLFISGEESKAGEIWSEFLENKPLVVLTHVLQTATKTEDVDLARRLVNQLRCSDKVDTLPGTAYSCLIKIYVAKNQCEDAMEALEEATRDGFSKHIKRGILKDLVQLLESQGKPIPSSLVLLTMESKQTLKEKNTAESENLKVNLESVSSDN